MLNLGIFSTPYAKAFIAYLSFILLLLYYTYKIKQNGEGGIRTLAPVNPTYTLSRGTSSANLSTSPNYNYSYCVPSGQDI